METSAEGVADEPVGIVLERLKDFYFIRFPDGREWQSWPGKIIRFRGAGRQRGQVECGTLLIR